MQRRLKSNLNACAIRIISGTTWPRLYSNSTRSLLCRGKSLASQQHSPNSWVHIVKCVSKCSKDCRGANLWYVKAPDGWLDTLSLCVTMGKRLHKSELPKKHYENKVQELTAFVFYQALLTCLSPYESFMDEMAPAAMTGAGAVPSNKVRLRLFMVWVLHGSHYW